MNACDSSLYLHAAKNFENNPGQLHAYKSQSHCVVLAGPGSGKTAVLTVKLARLLAEEVRNPRGIACITYNNECVREIESRLSILGIQPSARVYIGTVHSFSLSQIILPYAKSAGLNLPDDFQIASSNQKKASLTRAYDRVIGGQDDPQKRWELQMTKYRRSILDRNSVQWRTEDATLAQLVETYEEELRHDGLIDFEDMPLLALQALNNHEWVRKAMFAKFPILAVDEYQDLGHALHGMVSKLCFEAGIRLFAVGDGDQSIYGFTGADPVLLKQLSERQDVETVKLPLNYRCGSHIVAASKFALGEERDYESSDSTSRGTIYFHPSIQDYMSQANHLFAVVLPNIFERISGLRLGEIAVLYPAAYIGDFVAEAAKTHGLGITRTDNKALYPRYSRVMRWIELCAAWSCEGWRTGTPRFSKLVSESTHLFSDVLISQDDCEDFRRKLIQFLWESSRNLEEKLYIWLQRLVHQLLIDIFSASNQLSEEADIVDAFIGKLAPDGIAESMTLSQFAEQGVGINHIALSTLHSAKGREFRIVILFGMDQGCIPRHNISIKMQTEARRLFYVGFTRTKEELHIMYSSAKPSPFVVEVKQRLQVGA